MELPDLAYVEHEIPKKNGKIRKIVAPSEELKKHQRGYLPKLEKFFKKELDVHDLKDKDIFHGFIPGKNCVTAAKKHIGYQMTMMLDIKHFFDSVQFNFLPREYNLPQTLFHKEGYAAQGFPSSPMVANIAIVRVMADIYQRIKDLTRGDFMLTIYADDIQISLNNTQYLKAIESIVERAFFDNGYLINEKKTRVRFSKHGYRRILGVNVGDIDIRATRKTMRRIRAAKYQGGIATKIGKKAALKARQSAGGLVTWSQCKLPNKTLDEQITNIFG